MVEKALTAPVNRDKKRVFLDVAWKMHSLYKEFVDCPPAGYEFVCTPRLMDKTFQFVSQFALAYTLQHKIFSPIVPLVLAKSYAERYLKRPAPGTQLTYACEHLVFRPEDWVVSMTNIAELVGGETSHVRLFKKVLEKRLRSNRCKAIICYYEWAKHSLETALDISRITEKVFVVPLAVRSKRFVRDYNIPGLRLLFVGSANIPGQFEIKGGKEAVEAFRLLRQRYGGLEMIVRSDLPPALKERYQGIPGLRIIDRLLSWGEMEQEFLAANIFLLPAHCTVGMAMLDAMSYELPVVTTDVYANPEVVSEGVRGLLIRQAEDVPYYDNGLPVSLFTAAFTRAVRRTNQRMVRELVQKLSVLIENPALRTRMGRAARREVEEGRFSIAHRNRKLKGIFDMATNKELRL